ncbi:MAG: glycoside hydrolase family 20 zincin-like fold domain-containing protein, partial [Planctomycetota bacterium]
MKASFSIFRRIYAAALFAGIFQAGAVASAEELSLVPAPRSVERSEGVFQLGAEIDVVIDDDGSDEDGLWRDHLRSFGSHVVRLTAGKRTLRLSNERDAALRVRRDETLPTEAYRLQISGEGIELRASAQKGLAHGTATLLQLLGTADDGALPCLTIRDRPQLAYRSLMIDLGRNPHSLDLLKKTVDLLWFYRVDSLHLHLTDDQRFAFPSTAFPKLWDGKITR